MTLSLPSLGWSMVPAAIDQDERLEEVIVTAEFRRENLQQTPLAMSVVSADVMTQDNMTTLSDVGSVVPNVTLQPGGTPSGKTVVAFIRGVGSGDYNYTVEPGVAVYVDDVYLSGQFGDAFDLLDLDGVEVLRGPQGTLFGKNAIGGAIRLVSKKAHGDGSGAVEVTLGDFSRREARAFIDLPLVGNTLSMRLAAVSKQRDGYVDRLDFACVQPDLGGVVDPAAAYLLHSSRTGGNCKVGTSGGEDVQGLRAIVRWHGSESLEVNIVADWMNDHSEPGAQTLLAVDNSPGSPLNNPFGGFNANVAIPLYGVPYDNRFVPNSIHRSYDTYQPLLHVGPAAPGLPATVTGITSIPARNSVETYGVSAAVDLQLGAATRLKSISAWRGYSGTFSQDVGAAPVNVAAQTNILDHRQVTQEFQLIGNSLGGKLDWAAGLFYLDSHSLNRGPVTISAFSWLQPQLDITQNDPSHIRDRAVFGQVTGHLTTRLGLTLGARYTHEHKDYTFRHFSFDPGVPNLVPETPTQVNYGKTNGKVALDYRWTPRVMTYLSVANAFRAGGFNGRPFNASQVVSFGPETLTAYEIGIKSEAFEQRLRMNLAAFLSRYQDLQLPVYERDATGAPFSATVNQGRAQITGGEIEIELRPTRGLLVSGSLGLNKYENKELGNAINCNAVANPVATPAPAANCTPNGPLPGSPLPSLPERIGRLAIEYTLRLPDSSALTSHLDASAQSRVFFDAVGTPVAAVAGRLLLNGRFTWTSADSAWQVALSGTNLTNREYFFFKEDLRDIYGIVLGQPGPPREWAVTVRWSFR